MEVGRRSRAKMHLRPLPDPPAQRRGRRRAHGPGRCRAGPTASTSRSTSIRTRPGSSYPLSYLPGWAQEGGPTRSSRGSPIRRRASGSWSTSTTSTTCAAGSPSAGSSSRTCLVNRTWRARCCETWRHGGGSRWARPSATCSSSTTCAWAIASPFRSRRAAGGRWAATPSPCSRGPTRWPAPTSRRSARCAIRGRSAPIRGSSGGCGAEFGGISLETMINRMTDAPARRFGLTGRGRLERGYAADIVVFDAERIIDTATYDDPRQYPAGIPYVIVNGRSRSTASDARACWRARRCRRVEVGAGAGVDRVACPGDAPDHRRSRSPPASE